MCARHVTKHELKRGTARPRAYAKSVCCSPQLSFRTRYGNYRRFAMHRFSPKATEKSWTQFHPCTSILTWRTFGWLWRKSELMGSGDEQLFRCQETRSAKDSFWHLLFIIINITRMLGLMSPKEAIPCLISPNLLVRPSGSAFFALSLEF